MTRHIMTYLTKCLSSSRSAKESILPCPAALGHDSQTYMSL